MKDLNLPKDFVDPRKVLAEAGVKKGWTGADFGCGSGYFTIALAEKVLAGGGAKGGEDGKVYALDVLPSSLESVKGAAKIKELTNIILKKANIEILGGSGLKDGSLDVVVVKDVLFQNREKENIIKEAARVLKGKGMLIVVEWDSWKNFSIGPAADIRVKKEDVLEMAKDDFDFLRELNAGGYHYGLLFKRK